MWTSSGGSSVGEPYLRGSRPESCRLGDLPCRRSQSRRPPTLRTPPTIPTRGWLGEWFYIRILVEVTFPSFTGRRPEKQESWMWGTSSRQNKLEVIEMEL